MVPSFKKNNNNFYNLISQIQKQISESDMLTTKLISVFMESKLFYDEKK